MNCVNKYFFLHVDEDIEIELVEEEPEFLKGQGRSSLDLSPVKIVKVTSFLFSTFDFINIYLY